MSKKFMPFLLLCFLFVGISQNLSAQKCKTSQLRKQHIKQNPSILNETNRINQFTENWIANQNNAITSRDVETIPIVVHVIWQTSEENISDTQIQSQIEVLNIDFRKMNTNFSNTPAAFQALGADVEIEFCLASVDPFGNPTNGITRTQTDIAGIGEGDDWYQTSNGGKDAWDVTKYINIWVCNLGEDGLLGFATPPGTAEPPESDGMVIGYQFMGTTGAAANSSPNHLGRTVTHEMGHYFNLEHLWGENEGGCGEDDFVADTPSQDYESMECPSFPLLDNCTNSGNGIMFMNYMDYSDDDCMTMFSQGQKMRMLAALNGPRSSLLSSNGCANMTSTDDDFFVENNLNVYPNPTNDLLTIHVSNNHSNKNIQFKLIDVLGKEHLSFTIKENKTIDVSNLATGIYYLCAQEDAIISKKIIVNTKK